MAAAAKPNLGIFSGWASSEDGWDTGMNTNLTMLDTLVMGSVKDYRSAAPLVPTPSDGDRYLVLAPGSGGFASRDNCVAVYYGGAWTFYTPKKGWVVFVEDEHIHYIYDTAWVRAPNFVNAAHYATIQAAVDALPVVESNITGGTVYIPAGTYTTTTTPSFTAGLTLGSKDVGRIRLLGEGPGATVLHSHSTTSDYVLVKGDEVSIENMAITGPNGDSGVARGIVVGRKSSEDSEHPLRHFRLKNAILYGIPNTALWIRGSDTSREGSGEACGSSLSPIHTLVQNCSITQNYYARSPLVQIGKHCTTARFYNVSIGNNVGLMVRAEEATGINFNGCTFDTETTDTDPMIYFYGCTSCSVSDSYMESVVNSRTQFMIKLQSCIGVALMNLYMRRALLREAKAIWLANECHNILLQNIFIGMGACSSPSTYPNGTDDIYVDNTGSSYILIGAYCSDTSTARRVTISDAGTTKSIILGAAAGPAAADAGYSGRFKLPRLTTAEMGLMSSPMKGDMCYDESNNVLRFYNGSAWRIVTDTAP